MQASFPLPEIINDQTIQEVYQRYNDLQTDHMFFASQTLGQLSPEAIKISDELTAKGYPLPNEITDQAMFAEQDRVARLEAYATDIML